MTIKEAKEILVEHNEWRRFDGELGESKRMVNPTDLGIAIDTVVLDGWITIDNPPKDKQMVTACFDDNSVYGGIIYYSISGFYWHGEFPERASGVTHWMPLPEMPIPKHIAIAIDTLANLETFSKDDINNAYQKGYDDGCFDITH